MQSVEAVDGCLVKENAEYTQLKNMAHPIHRGVCHSLWTSAST